MRYLEVSNVNDNGIPYARLIVDGKKTWEVRWHNTSYRGAVAIIHENEILGTVNIVDTFQATPEQLTNHKNHMSTLRRMKEYARKRRLKKLYVWVLSDAKKLKQPRKIEYKFINDFSWSVPVR